jgi:hypothetical protein
MPDKKSQDNVDTAPVIVRRDVCLETTSELIAPDEKVEVVMCPTSSLWKPTLYLEPSSMNVIVDAVLCGQICLNKTPKYAHEYQYGIRLNTTANQKKPIKVILINAGTRAAIVRTVLRTRAGE